MDLEYFFDRPLAFHRSFVDLGAGITGALFLSQCIYWSKRTKGPSGWFYKSAQEWTDETGMSRREQETARKKLVKHGIIDERRSGIPAKLYFRVNFDALQNVLTRLHESDKQVFTNPPNWSGGKRQTNTEITTETTTNPSVSSDTDVSSETSPHEDLFDKSVNSKTMPEDMKQQVVEVYNRILAEQGLPKVKVLNTDRRKNLNKCWKDIPQARTLEWWEKYFDQCAKIGWFFTGHRKAPDWRASFGYLCRPDIATNVYEGAGMFVPS